MRATTCVIVDSHRWDPGIIARLRRHHPARYIYWNRPNQLTPAALKRFQPRYIFFLHWSHFIPANIFETYECVVFHMTDVPFGRGGSPLQNLIVRGFRKTKISALRVAKGIDAGDVYLKRPLLLHGTAQEIYERASGVIERMILILMQRTPKPLPQRGRVTPFKRRTPDESDLHSVATLRQAYDHIRMLDAQGYPHAFMETPSLRYEFTNAKCSPGVVQAQVKITRKGDRNA